MAAWLAHRNVPDRIRERNASATEPYRKTTTALSVEPTHDMLRGAQYTRRHCRLNAEDHDFFFFFLTPNLYSAIYDMGTDAVT
jgi:hypothetical protein